VTGTCNHSFRKNPSPNFVRLITMSVYPPRHRLLMLDAASSRSARRLGARSSAYRFGDSNLLAACMRASTGVWEAWTASRSRFNASLRMGTELRLQSSTR
jgi:hypothetical protein